MIRPCELPGSSARQYRDTGIISLSDNCISKTFYGCRVRATGRGDLDIPNELGARVRRERYRITWHARAARPSEGISQACRVARSFFYTSSRALPATGLR